MPSIRDVFPAKWLHADVLGGHRPRVIIEQVEVEKLFNPQTRKHEAKLVVKFHKKALRLILNKTQAFALADICKTDDYDKWAGHEVVISAGRAPNGKGTILISPVPDASPRPVGYPLGAAPQVEETTGLDDDEDVTDHGYDDNPFDDTAPTA
jgi:hypothetical protein